MNTQNRTIEAALVRLRRIALEHRDKIDDLAALLPEKFNDDVRLPMALQGLTTVEAVIEGVATDAIRFNSR